MKRAVIGDYVAENGGRNNTSMIVDIGNYVAEIENHHQKPTKTLLFIKNCHQKEIDRNQ